MVGAAAVVVIAAAVVTVLVRQGDDAPPASRDASPAPTLKPLRLGEKPLWRGPDDVLWGEARDGLMLFQHGDVSLSLYDATTGTPRWSMDKMHDLGGVVYRPTFDGGPDEQHLVGDGVLVQYGVITGCTRGFCDFGDENGHALLSTTDGHVLWRTPVLSSYPEVPEESRPNPTLRVADDRVAVASVLTGLVAEGYDKGTQLNVAIDVRTGTRLWERADGVWPMWIAGDTLLGVRSPAPPSTRPSGDTTGATIVGTDLMTGEQRWERPGARLVTVAGEFALVADGTAHLTVINAGDGKEIGAFRESVESCRSDRTALIACYSKTDGYDGDIVTFDAGRGKTGTATPGRATVLSLDAVRDGRIYVTGRQPRDPAARREYTLDGAGHEIDRELDLPGDLFLIAEGRAALSTDDHGDDTTAVYEVLT